MRKKVKALFTKITPLFVVTLPGLLLSIGTMVILFFKDDHGGLGTGLLSVISLILYAVFLADRYAVSRSNYKAVIISEAIILILIVLWCLFQ
jgi:K+-transporting ATPase A subunit